MKKITNLFSPTVWNWIIAFTVGFALPFGLQGTLASLISSLNTLPVSPVDPETSATVDPLLASVILFLGFIGYVTILSYQILFIARLKSHSSIFALVFTLVAPIAIWVVLPYSLGLL